MALKLDCRKFAPNIFNKTKCQNCFRPKDNHSAAALESNRISRKVCKCGYLFIAPDLDFSNPVNKSKRWQRRWFVLYDDGEFTFCVDDHPETVPQGTIDMNQCQDVSEAEILTGNQFSIGMSVPDKTYYIKANSQEEINWWFDALVVYPRSLANKSWRTTSAPSTPRQAEAQSKQEGKLDISEVTASDLIDQTASSSTKVQEIQEYKETCLDSPIGLPKLISVDQAENIPIYPHDVMDFEEVSDTVNISGSYSSVTDQSALSENSNAHISNTQSSMKLSNRSTVDYGSSNVLQSISEKKQNSEPSVTVDDIHTRGRYRGKYNKIYRRSKSDGVARMFPTTESSDLNSLTDTKPKYLFEVLSTPDPPKAKLKNPVYLLLSDAPIAKHIETFEKLPDKQLKKLESSDATKKSGLTAKLIDGFERRNSVSRLTPRMVRRGLNGTDLPARRSRSLTRNPGEFQDYSHNNSGLANISHYSSRSATHSPERWGLTESDGQSLERNKQEEKKNVEYFKKGWLLKKDATQQSWAKHWFVLSDSTLMYYSEPQAETEGRPDGGIDLSTIQQVQEVDVLRNYGFEISTKDSLPLIVSGMTIGIRSSWIEALEMASKGLLEMSSATSPIDIKALTEKLKPEQQRDRKRETARSRPRRLDLEKVAMSDKLLQDLSSKTDTLSTSLQLDTDNETDLKMDTFDSQEDEIIRIENHEELRGLLKQPSSPPPSKTPISLIKERSKMRSPFKTRTLLENSQSIEIPSSRASIQQNESCKVTSDGEKENSVSINISEKKLEEFNSIPDNYINVPKADTSEDNKLTGGDAMVVELLEAEVESLKAQLEHTQSELANTHDANTELKAQLQALRRDHFDSYTELESEHSRYLLQIEDVNRSKDDIELENVRLHNRLTEVKNQSDTSTLQIKMLKDSLKQGRDTIRRQQMEIEGLRTKLDISVSGLTDTECALSESLTDINFEKEKFLKLTDDWSKRFKNMEVQLRDTLSELEQKGKEIRDKRDKLRQMKSLEQKHYHAIHKLTNLIKKLEESESLRKKYMKEKDDLEKKLNDAENRLKQLVQLGGNMSPMSPLSPLSEDQNISRLEEALSNTENTGFEGNQLVQNNEEIWQLKEEIKKLYKENSSLKTDFEKETTIIGSLNTLINEKDNKIANLEKLMQEQKVELMTLKVTVENRNNPAFAQLVYNYGDCLKEIDHLSKKLQNVQVKGALDEAICEKQKREFSETHEAVKELQYKLNEMESLIKECPLFIKDGSGSPGKLSSKHEEEISVSEYSEIKKKLYAAVNEIRQLRKMLKEANSSTDNMEIDNVKLKQDVKIMEIQHEDEIILMGSRIEDLTNKLINSEKNVRNLDEALTKLETKNRLKKPNTEKELDEIENKVIEIERSLGSQENEATLEVQIGAVQELVIKIDEQAIEQMVKPMKEKGSDPAAVRDTVEPVSVSPTPVSTPTKRDHKVQVNLDRRKRTSDLGLKKLPRIESLLKSLQKQLVGLVEGVMAIKKLDQEGEHIRSLEHKVAGMIQEVQQFESKWSTSASSQDVLPTVSSILQGKNSISEHVRQFAEKLAFEAILVGELTYIASKRSQISEIKLDKKEQNPENILLNKEIKTFSSKLADKILVDVETVTAVKETTNEDVKIAHGSEKYLNANLKIHACEKSLIRLLPAVENFASSLASKIILMGIYSFLIQFIKEQLLYKENSVKETKPQECVQKKNRLSKMSDIKTIHNENSVSDFSSIVSEISNSELTPFIEQTCLQEAHELAKNIIETELANEEMAIFMNKFAHLYEKEILFVCKASQQTLQNSQVEDEKRFGLIEKVLKNEMDQVVERLRYRYVAEMDHFKETLQNSLINNGIFVEFTDLIAQRISNKNKEHDQAVESEEYEDKKNRSDRFDYFKIINEYANLIIKEAIQEAEQAYLVKQRQKNNGHVSSLGEQTIKSENLTTENIAGIRMRYEEILNREREEFSHALYRVEAELQRVKKQPESSEGEESSDIRYEPKYLLRDEKLSCPRCAEFQAKVDEQNTKVQKEPESIIKAFTKQPERQSFMDVAPKPDATMRQRYDELSAAVVDLLHSDKSASQSCKSSEVDEHQDLSDEAQTIIQLENRIKELEEQLQSFQAFHLDQIKNLKAAYESEINTSDYIIDQDTIRQKYVAEINMLKAFFEKHIQTTEQSHHHIIEELKKHHRKEIEQMRLEKEQVLAEETKATIAALEAMRKAHQSELESELTRLREISLAQASKSQDSSGIYNDEVLESIRVEIQALSEKYSVKCMEIAALEELVEIQKKYLEKFRARILELIGKNEELVTQIGTKAVVTDAEKTERVKVVQELQEMLKEKENEVIQLRRTILELHQEIHSLHIEQRKVSSEPSLSSEPSSPTPDDSSVNLSVVVKKPPLPSSLGTLLKQRASIVKELHPPDGTGLEEESDPPSLSSEVKLTNVPTAVKGKETKKSNGNSPPVRERSQSPGRRMDCRRSKMLQDRSTESLTRL